MDLGTRADLTADQDVIAMHSGAASGAVYRALGCRFLTVFFGVLFAAAFMARAAGFCVVGSCVATRHCLQRPPAALSSLVISSVPGMILPQ
jgi:hypothetical protein